MEKCETGEEVVGASGGGEPENQPSAKVLSMDCSGNNEELLAMKCGDSGEGVDADAGVSMTAECDGVEGTMEEGASRKNEVLYAVHRDQLLKYLPEELWQILLEKLKDSPEDLENCANSSPYFWELVQDLRCLFLFPKVIKGMALIYEEQGHSLMKVSREVDTSTLDIPLAFMESDKEWRVAVLNCRLTCSSWNKAVEQRYQQPEMTGLKEFVKDLNLNPISKLNTMVIKWTKENQFFVRKAIKKFEFTHSPNGGSGAPPKNPFIGRYAILQIFHQYSGTKELHEGYRVELNQLLNLFGKDIWYCHLKHNSLFQDVNDQLQFAQKLKGLLCLMPNLRSLRIDIYRKPETENWCVDFPKLEKLELLDMKNIPTSIASQLLRANSHVSFLNINCTEFEEDIGRTLVNLEGFRAEESVFGQTIMENCGSSWTKMKRLWLNTRMDRNGLGQEMTFKFLQDNWSNTLTEVNLQFPDCSFWEYLYVQPPPVICEESRVLRLELNCVRRLNLFVSGWIYLDFALPMKKSLEQIVCFVDIVKEYLLKMRSDVYFYY